MRFSRIRVLAGSLMALVLCASVAVAGGVGDPTTEVADTIAVVKDDETLSNAEVAVRLSEITFAQVEQVVIGRDDDFADAMASAVLQDDAPLLLTPPAGPLPDRVRQELARNGATSAVLLGGTAALSEAVEQELIDLGLTVQRRQGATRFQTATDIAANDAPGARTAVLARAFSNDPMLPSRAFADSIAVGGLAAIEGWPILLTQTEDLNEVTRDYLLASEITDVLIAGGTAAISATVEDELVAMGYEVERIAGDSRAGTAVAVAGRRGGTSAADVARTILVDGESDDAWAGGFAGAAHSAANDAPILLASSEGLPPETEDWLEGDTAAHAFAGGDPDPVRLTCVTLPTICDQARTALGLPELLDGVSVVPVNGATIPQNARVELVFDDATGVDEATLTGDCVADTTIQLFEGRAGTRILANAAEGPCTLTWTFTAPSGATQRTRPTYTIEAREPAGTADFDWSEPAIANEPVAFDDATTNDPVAWAWSFGNGDTSTLQFPETTYPSVGSYTVRLTATFADGTEDTAQRTVSVVTRPDASFTWSTTNCGPTSFTDTSSPGNPGPSSIVSWFWSFGGDGFSTQQNPSVTLSDNSPRTVSLTVTDSNGATDSTSQSVTQPCGPD